MAAERPDTKENCKKLNNKALDAFGNYQSDTTQRASLDSAMALIDSAIRCDTNYMDALHNKFTMLYETGQYRPGIVVLQKLQRRSHERIPLLIANEALCNYLIGETQEYERLRSIAIRESETQAGKSPDDQHIGQVLMIRTMLKGQEDALGYLQSLEEQGLTTIDFAQYRELIRTMPAAGSRRTPQFNVSPR